ncbi:MAG: hypothetical protein FJZ58_04510, partial [Chlamydiae bacterium]|nr:hypothetical protein [Chlamydiota bacterium]
MGLLKKKQHLKTLNTSLFLGSGILAALGQPALYPLAGALFACLGIALHWKGLDGLSIRTARRVSFLWFFLVQLFQLSWLTAIEYQGVFILGVYVLLAAGMAWQFAFLTKILQNRSRVLSWLSIGYLSACWVGLEWMRLYVLCGFAFNFLGIALGCHLYSLQMASLCGVLGMSFWVVMTNVLALNMLRARTKKRVLLWGVVALTPYLLGSGRLFLLERPLSKETKKDHTVLLVQTGLSPAQKEGLPRRNHERIPPMQQWENVICLLSKEKIAEADWIVLPEVTFPCGLYSLVYPKEQVHRILHQYFGDSVCRYFSSTEGEIVSNAYWLEILSSLTHARVVIGLHSHEEGKHYNSIFLFQDGTCKSPRYDK